MEAGCTSETLSQARRSRLDAAAAAPVVKLWPHLRNTYLLHGAGYYLKN
jgi:hypothetical protein